MTAQDLIMDFKPIKEEWTDYALEDGTMVRLKVVLSYIEEEGKHHSMNVHHVTAVWVPHANRNTEAGEAALPVDELERHVVQEGVKFDPRSQGQSVYKTQRGAITLEARAIRFHRTSKYDPQGAPQYIIEQEIRTSMQDRPAVPGHRKPKQRPASKKA